MRDARVPRDRELPYQGANLPPWNVGPQLEFLRLLRTGLEPSALTASALDIALTMLGGSPTGSASGADFYSGRRYASHTTILIAAGFAANVLPTDTKETRARKMRNNRRRYFMAFAELREMGGMSPPEYFPPRSLEGCEHERGSCRCDANKPRRHGLTRDAWVPATVDELRELHAAHLERVGVKRIREPRERGVATKAAGAACPQRAPKRKPVSRAERLARLEALHAPATPERERSVVIRNGDPKSDPNSDPKRVAEASDHRFGSLRTCHLSESLLKPSTSSSSPDPQHSAEAPQDDSPSAHRPSGPRFTPPAQARASQAEAVEATEPTRAGARSTHAEAPSGFATVRLAAVPSGFEGGGSPSPRAADVERDVAMVIADHRDVANHRPLPGDPVERQRVAERLARWTIAELGEATRGQQQSHLNRDNPARLTASWLFASDDRVAACRAAHLALERKAAKARREMDRLDQNAREAADVMPVVSTEGATAVALEQHLGALQAELEEVSAEVDALTSSCDFDAATPLLQRQRELVHTIAQLRKSKEETNR